MTHVYLISIGLIIIVLTRRIYYRNFELFLCLLVMVNFEFFHLIPRIGEFDQYKEILLVVIVFYLFEEFIAKQSFHKFNSSIRYFGYFGKISVTLVIMSIFGIFIAHLGGQNILLCIKTFKYYPLLLTYFLIAKRDINTYKFTTYLLVMASFLAFLSFIQFYTFDNLSFFYFYENSIYHIRDIDSPRGLRILLGSTIITIGTIIGFTKWLKTGNIFFLFLFFFLILHIIIVIQTRAILTSTIIAVTFTLFYYYRKHYYKIIKYFFFAIGIISFISMILIHNKVYVNHNGMLAQTKNDIQEIFDRGQGSGSLKIRILCYRHYWNEFKNVWFTGRGLINSSWSKNNENFIQISHNFYLSDIGFFHLLLNFGIFGVVFLLIFIISTLCKIGKLIDKGPTVACYFIIGLTIFPQTDLFFSIEHFLVFSIFAALADIKLHFESEYSNNTSSVDIQLKKSYQI